MFQDTVSQTFLIAKSSESEPLDVVVSWISKKSQNLLTVFFGVRYVSGEHGMLRLSSGIVRELQPSYGAWIVPKSAMIRMLEEAERDQASSYTDMLYLSRKEWFRYIESIVFLPDHTGGLSIFIEDGPQGKYRRSRTGK